MGLLQLMDATARERCRRLLGEDMVTTVRRPSHAQLGAAITTSEVVGQVKQQSGYRLCPGPAENEDASLLLQVDGPLCSKLTGATLVDGRCHLSACLNATSQEIRGPEAIVTAFNTTALCSSSAVLSTGKTDANASYVLNHVEQTHRRTVPSEKVGGVETLIHGQMPIFVRHCSGELTFTVNMHESTNAMMKLYSERTNTTLDSQYFVYERKRLEPQHTWLSLGLKRDTTVHVCTRLLGGAGHPNLQEYINSNKDKFVTTVSLPNRRTSLQMTPIGCQFLSSWIRCFTAQFIQGRSWNGEFELVDFKFVEGHVRPKAKGKVHGEPSAIEADIIKLVDKVRSILNFSHIPNVVSSHPPYVQSCMKMLCDLVGPLSGPITDKNGHLSNKYKVLLDTLVCCMTSNARESLIIELYRKYEGADKDETAAWEKAIKDANCKVPRLSVLSSTTMFGYYIGKEMAAGNPYSFENTGAFTLLRDVVMHATDRSGNPNAPKPGDANELMIAATLEDFLPRIIKNLIENNIDISKELSAAISCACDICDACDASKYASK